MLPIKPINIYKKYFFHTFHLSEVPRKKAISGRSALACPVFPGAGGPGQEHVRPPGFNPSEKYEFVSWDDDSHILWKNMFQTTNQYIQCLFFILVGS